MKEKQRMLALVLSLLVATLLLGVSIPAWGQVGAATGTVVGIVTDPSGAVVPGATVTLTDNATGTTRTATTNDQGRYVFVNANPASYNLTVSKSGFANAKMANQVVQIGQQLTANVQLQVGQASTEVVVEGTANSSLQTLNSTIGNTVSQQALSSLPSLGRDVSTFMTLQPGVSPDGSVAGTVVDQSSFQLDGGNNTNDMDGSMNVYTPSFAGDPTGVVGGGATGVMPTPADSVEEFKVNSANQTADFNSSSGAQVQVVTKRGTNAWHADAYEYYLDNNFSANSWQNNHQTPITPAPSYHYSRFGFSGGGPILPKMLGGKTYFFANYQGFRWPNSTTILKSVPSVGMREGLLQWTDKAGNCQVFNLNPAATTYTGPSIGCMTNNTSYPSSGLDPRNVGVNPVVQAMWNKYMPLPNDFGNTCSSCEGQNNVLGFRANMAVPQTDNFGVARFDHDFGANWHFMSSYRYYHLIRTTADQIDIGGFLPGHTLGTPASASSRPQVPWYVVAGMTTNITPNFTNDFHFSYLRNYWAWSTVGDPTQAAALGGAIEPFGETTNALVPMNVNTQQTRTRFWDGQDWLWRDDLSLLKGNHLFQFGGSWARNVDIHQRTDNGGGINNYIVYQLGTTSSSGISSVPVPAIVNSAKKWGRLYAADLGIVSISQVAYTRSGPTLTLNPLHTPAQDHSIIPYYNTYFSDTWHVKPTFTFTYGLGWALEMPPFETQGKQVQLVDASDQQLDVNSYIENRRRAALQGQVYNPAVGFALVGNTQGGQKYPYQPFYGEFSPRVSAAWNPHFDGGMMETLFGKDSTVIRGGYGRLYGRLNGVDLVLVPLLGTGLIQPVQCKGALNAAGAAANGGNPCPGVGGANPTTAFRIGVDGNTAPLPTPSPTLPQPDFPGINAVAAGAGEALDPHFRPNVVDSFDLTIQRQFGTKTTIELGYIGRRITHEYQPININSVPYMMTLGGQTFANAYANIEKAMGCTTSQDACQNSTPASLAAVAPQPFFETALAGTGYCTPGTCTQTVIANEFGNFQCQCVWDLWSDLDQGGIQGNPANTVAGFNFPRSMMNTPITDAQGNPTTFGAGGQLSSGVGVNASVGHGNYHAGFLSVRMTGWHGVTSQSNFTYSKALGTGAFVQATSEYTPNDPFNLDTMYGVQAFNRKFVFNEFVVYEPTWYHSQQGLIGRVLGGWNFAPIFTAGSGAPVYCNTNTDSEAFGSGDAANFFDNEQCILTKSFTGSHSIHYNVKGSNGIGTSGYGLNMFSDPSAVWTTARPPVLGYDFRDAGLGPLSGLPYWNLDLSVRKNIRIAERVSTELQMVVTNVLNHFQPQDPYLDLTSPSQWGTSGGQQNSPRTMEFGVRISF